MEQESIRPDKSPNDKREYEAITLSNQLKIMFVSDPEVAKSACSISVGVGSIFDYQRSLGIAHFLQHMLFMGSNKFPSHNEYSSFITNNSGSDNAYTSDEETNYYFQIKNSAFVQAVERITDFFTGALLKQQCVEKERQAVHEQFVLWANDDNCRKWQILRKMASPPYSKFTIGNNQTLNHPKIREDLVDFYERYYSSNIINAVLYSNMSIQEMKKQCIKFFQVIPNKNVQLPKLEEHFNKSQKGKLIQMQSIKDESIMEYFWVIQYLKPYYKTHINDYLVQLLGHQGQNSLLSILKKKQLANQLSAYTNDLKTQTLACIEVKLTQSGKQNYQDVYNIVMDYVGTFQASDKFFEEIKQKNKIKFQFKEKSQVSREVCNLSSKMHHYPVRQVLNYSVLFDEFNQDFFKKILGQINPFNVLIVYSHHDELQGSITEKYLGGKYKVCQLPNRKKILTKHQPIPPNKFIPIDKTLFPLQKQVIEPKLLRENVYYLSNRNFGVCKCGIRLNIYNTGHKPLFFQMYSVFLEYLFKQLSYPAQVLATQVQYEDDDDRMSIQIFGFNDTVCKLLQQISTRFLQMHKSQQMQLLFELTHEKVLQDYENFYLSDVDDIVKDTIDLILVKNGESIQENIEHLQKYQIESFFEEIKNFWNTSTFQWIVVGNITVEKTESITNLFEIKIRQNQVKPLQQVPCLKIDKNISHEILLQAQDISLSACIVYYQAGQYNENLFYRLKLLQNHINEPFFNALRTQKQLAYYLTSQVVNNRGILGLRFLLVSSTLDPEGISQQIKKFVEQFFANLNQNMEQPLFTQIKESVLTKITEPHQNLSKLFNFIIKEIEDNTFCFTRKSKEQVKKYLDIITLQDLNQTWQQISKYSFDVLVVSKTHRQSYQKHSKPSTQFKTIKEQGTYWQDKLLSRFIKNN